MTTSQIETLRDTINDALQVITNASKQINQIKEPWTLPRQLPGFRALRDGEKWHFADKWKQEWLPNGTRPLLVGEDEMAGDEAIFSDGTTSKVDFDGATVPLSMRVPRRTKRPLPILTPEQIAQGWKEWHGGKNPAPGKTVSVLFRDGNIKSEKRDADWYCWHHAEQYDDIIAYRVIEPKFVPLGPEDVRCGDELQQKDNRSVYGISAIHTVGVDIATGFKQWDYLREFYLIRRRNSETFEPCSKEAAQ